MINILYNTNSKRNSKQDKDLEIKESKDKKTGFRLRFYSGYKSSETPRAVVIGSKEFPIQEILWRKRICDHRTGKKAEVFSCRMKGEKVKITLFESGEWEISFSDQK